MDDRSWKCCSGPAIRRDGCCAANASESSERKPKIERTGEGQTKVVESKTLLLSNNPSLTLSTFPATTPWLFTARPYPYPPISYTPPGDYAAGMAISFGVGMAMGAAWGGGGWCCNSGWGGNNDITINNNNSYVNNSNRQNVNNSGNRTGNRTGGGNNWQHNPQHRGGALLE